jgi:hypothetical protein
MTKSWISEFVLEELNKKNNKSVATTTTAATAAAASSSTTTTSSRPPRLIQILGRGGDYWTSPTVQSWIVDPIRRRNVTTDLLAWLLVSDGEHTIKVMLTTDAMKLVLENEKDSTANERYRFLNYGRGRCALVRDYTVDVVSMNDNEKSLQLRCNNIEAKPGFQLMLGGSGCIRRTTTRNASRPSTVKPIEEDLDVRYALQHLQEQQQGEEEDGNTAAAPAAAEEAAVVDFVFDGSAPQRPPGPVLIGDVMTKVMNKPNIYNQILQLALHDSDSDEQQQVVKEEEQVQNKTAEKDSESSSDDYSTAQESEDGIEQSNMDTPSKLYIQNVLMTQEEEEEEEKDDEDEEDDEETPTQSQSQFQLETQPTLLTQPQSQQRDSTPLQSNKMNTSNRRETRYDAAAAAAAAATSSTSVWESVKAQLANNNNNKMIYFDKEYHGGGGGGGGGATPSQRKRRLHHHNTPGTPAPSSAAYFRKHGLARWLSHNTIKTTTTTSTTTMIVSPTNAMQIRQSTAV